MAEELGRALGIEPELVPGRGGVFEVEADGRLVFTKREAGRFPLAGEVVGLLCSV